MKKVVIIGAGGFAREAASFLERSNLYKVVGFVGKPDDEYKGNHLKDIPILGDDNILEKLYKEKAICAFIAIGNADLRQSLFKKICDVGFEPINIIHPSAYIAQNVILGKGVIVYPNTTINTDVKIGDAVLINSNVSVGHDVVVGNYVNICPGVNIAGRVKIGESAFLGIGCSVLERVVIGRKAIVGGGALVRENILPGKTVVGVPAKETGSKEK